jgi:tripartite-type tricarboxylate transporter receptor subunit TctC
METQKVKTCFTITFTDDQYSRAKDYVDEMKRHPQRVFWRGKEGKTEQELVVEQIAHRILSGFYNNEPYEAGKHILRMDSMATA